MTRYLRERKVATAQGRGPAGYSPFLPRGFSGKGRDTARIWMGKERAEAAASSVSLSLSLSFREGRLS